MAEANHDSPFRTRVNATLLQQFHGKHICFLGFVIKADGGGTAFQVRGCDGGGPINVRLKSPITEPLSGLIEIYGIGQGKNLIIADSITTFPEEMSSNFDANTYNEAVRLIHTVEKNAWVPA